MAVVLQASGEAIGTVVDLYDGTGARGRTLHARGLAADCCPDQPYAARIDSDMEARGAACSSTCARLQQRGNDTQSEMRVDSMLCAGSHGVQCTSLHSTH